jgi:hypothetical protein
MPSFEHPSPDDTATPIKAPTRQGCSTAAPIRDEPTCTSTPIARAHKRIEDVLTAFEHAWGDIAAAEQRGVLTPDGRAEAVAAATSTDAIDEAAAQAAARVERADADYQAAIAALSPHSNTALDVLDHDMFWRRTSRELDSVPTERVVALTRRLVEDAKPQQLGWLAVELPSYLRSRGMHDDWLDTALQQAVPSLRAAAEQHRKAIQAAQIISANGRTAKNAMRSALHGSYRRPIGLVDLAPFDPDK